MLAQPLAARRAQLQITSAMQLLGLFEPHDEQHWRPKAMQMSALQAQGLDEFWSAVQQFQSLEKDNGRMDQRRQEQALVWMWERIDAGLKQGFRKNPLVGARLPDLERQVRQGSLPASAAARTLLDIHLRVATGGTRSND